MDRSELEPLLYAPVGEDQNGQIATVLPTLTRLGLDPWKEVTELAVLGRDAAYSRLGLLLSRFRDVPTLVCHHGLVAQKLTLLLSERRALAATMGERVTRGPLTSRTMIWVLLVVLFSCFS